MRLRKIAAYTRVSNYIPNNNGAQADHCVFPDTQIVRNHRSRTNPNMFSDRHISVDHSAMSDKCCMADSYAM